MSNGDFSFSPLSVESVTISSVSAANSNDPDLYTFPTLRDQFALSALSGILSNPNTPQNTPHYVADDAYRLADAMLLRRKQP